METKQECGRGGSGGVGQAARMIRANPPMGILRVELGGNRSRKSSAELKILQQGEPVSPQPSIDRLSVTFADDSLKSDISPRPIKMDKVHFPDVPVTTENTDSDEEDYSASVNAIMLRRESTRRKSKRRKSTRRASSPFSPDILPGTENGRRRSSNFTTSSDTAITMDENLGATQEEIFENIKLHKEVLSNVKMQPWNMRKKLKLVTQAKNYIKKHEGALQERLAQSRSTKDMLARWNIYILTNWQKYRREIANVSNWFIPWELKIKEIESHFGSVVASYFIFLRWLFWVNVVLAVVLISFVAVPEDQLNIMWLEVLHFSFSIIVVSGFLFPVRNDYSEIIKYVPPEEEITFHLYHSNDLSKDDQLFINDIFSIQKSRFNPLLPTKVIIHGWTHGKDIPWVIELRETMAKLNLWNIIVVDWAPLSHALYVEARVHTIVVAKQVTNFCLTLHAATNISMTSIHIIGHSMGAQIAAMTGHKLKTLLNQNIGRITGLDPAAPLYEWPHIESLDEILDPSDANFVDVIHTNAKHLGIFYPAGHVDFYPNGGDNQPGCVFWSCSHLKACEFWIASIKNPFLFKAYHLDDWDDYIMGRRESITAFPMGIAAGPFIPFGSYYLETRGEEEYYLETKTEFIDSFNWNL